MSVSINPSKDLAKIVNLFEKYGANMIKVIKLRRNLEDFFVEVVGE